METFTLMDEVGEGFGGGWDYRIGLSDVGTICLARLSDDSRMPTDKVILAHFLSCSIVEFFKKDFSIFLLVSILDFLAKLSPP